MFKNVIVGVDGRSSGRDAIALARRLSDPAGSLTLLHVHPHESSEVRAESAQLLERERTAADLEAELLSVVSPSPGRGLHEQAEAQGADLLVVGSSRHGAFGRTMLGDDTRAALNGAPCAVAIASHGYAGQVDPIRKVGVGYNGSPESAAALALARGLAGSSSAKVFVLEVVSIPAFAYTGMVAPALGDTIEAMLKESIARISELPDVEGRAVYGIAGEELAAFGGTVDILVVGSRGFGPVRRLVLGSTSEFLESHSRCPLIVLPRLAADADTAG